MNRWSRRSARIWRDRPWACDATRAANRCFVVLTKCKSEFTLERLMAVCFDWQHGRQHPVSPRRSPPPAASAGDAGTDQAGDMVPADVGLSVRHRVGRCRAARLVTGAAGRRAGRAGGLWHEPGGERLVRPARGRDQRTAPAHPVGAHPGPLGAVDRAGHVGAVAGHRLVPGALGLWHHHRGCAGHLGLFGGADPAEAVGLGVGASGTSLLALLATATAPHRRAAATITWLMMIFGIAVTAPAARLVPGE